MRGLKGKRDKVGHCVWSASVWIYGWQAGLLTRLISTAPTGILAACCQNVRAKGARIAYSAPEDGRAGNSRVSCESARRSMTAKAGIPLSFWPEARKVVRTTLSGVPAAEGDMLAICQVDAVCAGGPDREKKVGRGLDFSPFQRWLSPLCGKTFSSLRQGESVLPQRNLVLCG